MRRPPFPRGDFHHQENSPARSVLRTLPFLAVAGCFAACMITGNGTWAEAGIAGAIIATGLEFSVWDKPPKYKCHVCRLKELDWDKQTMLLILDRRTWTHDEDEQLRRLFNGDTP